MSVAAALRGAGLAIAVIAAAACWEAPPGQTSSSETDEDPVFHRDASATCIAGYQQCYAGCETSPANCDVSPDAPLCFPTPARVADCRRNCAETAACMPWEIGVITGPPCRWSDELYECNFFLCSAAATACLMDCFDLYLLTDLGSEPNQITCQEACYDHYGCRPRPSDPCSPLPAGYIHCACPAEHGVECHPDDEMTCS